MMGCHARQLTRERAGDESDSKVTSDLLYEISCKCMLPNVCYQTVFLCVLPALLLWESIDKNLTDFKNCESEASC